MINSNMRLNWLCALVVMSLALSVAVLADVRTPAPPHGQRAYDGIVMSAAAERLVLRETTTGTEMAFRVAANASIVRNGEPASLANVRGGDSARIVTDSDGRDMLVTAIDARGAR